jgi:two-component system OmpR family response regulator
MVTRKILIIDDETDFCLLLKSYFVRKKYDVYLSYSLDQGMKLLEQVKPDIIFLDNNLPDGFGWEKVDDIKKTFPDIELNLISAYENEPPTTNFTDIHVWEKPLQLNELSKVFS